MEDEKQILHEAFINSISEISDSLRRITEGKTRPTLYITDNYILKNYSSDQNYVNIIKPLIIMAGVGDVCIYSEGDEPGKNRNHRADLAAIQSDFNALDGRNVSFTHHQSHGRYWIVDDAGFMIDASPNGVMSGDPAIVKKLTKQEVKDIKSFYGIA